jgi:hypothetical protein
MEERSRKGELMNDVGNTSSHKQIERVVVRELQHPTRPGRKQAEVGPNQTQRSLVSARLPSCLLTVLPRYFVALSPRIIPSLNFIVTQSSRYLRHTRPNGPLNEIRHAQEVARPPTLLGHDHRAFLLWSRLSPRTRQRRRVLLDNGGGGEPAQALTLQPDIMPPERVGQ